MVRGRLWLACAGSVVAVVLGYAASAGARGVIAGGALRSGTITAGGRHTCAIKTDGTPTCWGSNRDGQASVPRGHGDRHPDHRRRA